MIRSFKNQDITQITQIYNHYLENTFISFEETKVSEAQMQERIDQMAYPFLVKELDQRIVGFAYADLWRTRSAYRHTLESTIYIDQKYHGQKIGSTLYHALFKELEPTNAHTIIAIIALPNEASIRLHQQCGFKKVAYFKQVGFKFNQWIDVEHWQKMI